MSKRHLKDESNGKRSLADIIYDFLPTLAAAAPHHLPDGSSRQLVVSSDLVYEIQLSFNMSIAERSIKKALKNLTRRGLLEKTKLDPPGYYWVVTPPQKS